jgi:maltoporin
VPITVSPAAEGFGFGSYGRVGAGTDLGGATPVPVNVVQHGPRVVENTYVELHLSYGLRANDDVLARVVATPALAGDLFHASGDFDASLAIRNLYAEATFYDAWNVWVGSRMYRGDDIYLLDYWPLDNLNTVGGGVGLATDRFDVRAHFGLSRLLAPFQFQELTVPARLTGGETIVKLDRQRFVGSLKGGVAILDGDLALRIKANLEVHGLPAGERQNEGGSTERLASDFGWSAGAQLGGAALGSSANLFLRYSRGLAAYDPLRTPAGLSETKQTYPRASELVLGAGGAFDLGIADVQLGAYARYFRDADRVMPDADDGWEGVVDVRPSVSIVEYVALAADLSYQQRFPRGPSPTALEVLNPSVVAVAPMVIVSPFGDSVYARPQLRAVYRAAYLNDGARDLYPFDDPRRGEPWVHFFGVQAEWWFDDRIVAAVRGDES